MTNDELEGWPIVIAVDGAGDGSIDPVQSAGDIGDMNWQDVITFEAGKRTGKPCIRNLRITVYDILEYLASGMTPEEIVADFPELAIGDIQAALAFAADRERRLAGHAA